MIIKRCGGEPEWPHNTPRQIRERQFLEAGVRFLADVVAKERINPANAALIFCIPGGTFCLSSGNHKWEFFLFEVNGEIEAGCWRMPTYRWLWQVAERCWRGIVNHATNFVLHAVGGNSYVPVNALTEGRRCTNANCPERSGSNARYCQRCGRALR